MPQGRSLSKPARFLKRHPLGAEEVTSLQEQANQLSNPITQPNSTTDAPARPLNPFLKWQKAGGFPSSESNPFPSNRQAKNTDGAKREGEGDGDDTKGGTEPSKKPSVESKPNLVDTG